MDFIFVYSKASRVIVVVLFISVSIKQWVKNLLQI